VTPGEQSFSFFAQMAATAVTGLVGMLLVLVYTRVWAFIDEGDA
jgi:low affinity Fe/Cu permease